MNFLAHAAVAARHDDDPRFVLGAALPDLLPLIGVRVERDSLPARVVDGWMEHHRADAAFHEHGEFVRGVSALRLDLRATDLGTGPRRAAAHVGWELLLDEAVMSDEVGVAAFADAVRAGRGLIDDPNWRGLVDRISGLRPAPPQTAHVVAERVQRACSRRERLAFEVELVPQLASVLAVHQPHVNAVASLVLDEVSRS